MQWLDILPLIDVEATTGALRNAPVRGLQYDSRRVQPGDLFVAIRGGTSDGNRFIDVALKYGATAIVTDSHEAFDTLLKSSTPAALVQHGRRALSEAASALFDFPQRKLKLSAVTGTNGKTTTAFLLEQLLQSVGRQCLLLGTIETHIAGEVRRSEHTTPESRDILALFAEAVQRGCTEVVMEMSSHALEQERVWALPVDVAIFTNLTQDHLDYHGTMKEYARAKARLFQGVGAPPPRIAVINDDAHYAGFMIDSYAGEEFIVRYGTTESANHRAEDIEIAPGQTSFRFVTPAGTVQITSPLTGMVNVENLMAAMCAAMARGLTLQEVQRAARHLKPVPGRFEVVPGSADAGFTVVVDYAHTDDALANLIVLARALGKPTNGRVLTLFGCGGDRDRTKRPKMGKVAGDGSDMVILTSDNPRSENPSAIIEEVLVGMTGTSAICVVEADRHAAITLAIHSAKPGDIVLLAGKGHEKTQTFADKTVPFDDVAEAAEVLRTLKTEGNS